MTISSTVNRKEYTGNGVTRTFSFPYYLLVKADLRVFVAGVEKTLDTHYTITGTPTNGPWPDGVTVTFPAPAAAPASAASIVILRDPAITQGVDLVENDELPVEASVEQPLDRLTMIAQRLSERVDRSFALADTDITGASTELPTPEASKIIGWDSDGLALINYAAGDLDLTILVSSFMETVLDDVNAAAARTTLGTYSTAEVDAAITAAVAAAVASLVRTGDAKLTIQDTADAGWVLFNDLTLGNAASGATGRANADTEDLFTLMWTKYADAQCAVSGGRGASAAADYAAGKTIAMPKALGRALAVAGAGSGLTARVMGFTTGEETHTLTVDEMPAHTHSYTNVFGSGAYRADGSASGAHSVNTGSTGGDGAHNNMQPTSFAFNVMVKL